MFPSGSSRGSSMEKFLSQNAYFKTKNFIQNWSLNVKFQESDGYFPSLGKDEFAYVRNSFIANTQMLQSETGTQEELVEL